MVSLRPILLHMVIGAAGGIGIGWLLRSPEPRPKPTAIVVTRIDTVRHSERLVVPYPVPGRDSLIAIHHWDTTLVYIDRHHLDTVYADCDSARRYVATHSDTNGRVTYTADVCGRILSHSLRYDLYSRHTTTTLAPAAPRTSLYALATSGGHVPAFGLLLAHGAVVGGYQYQPGPSAQHLVTVGYRLLTKKHK